MALPVSVPLLLLPLLLSSTVANVYQPLAGVTNVQTGGFASVSQPSASECADYCDSTLDCTAGYVYENGQCQRYKSDCRNPESDGYPAPENYMARLACPGTKRNPCECPAGFHRYGARCLQLLNQPETSWIAARTKCNQLHADLAVPRSQEENDQVILAATELQTAPLTKIWLGIECSTDGDSPWTLYGFDNCGSVTQVFWASGGQPGATIGELAAVYSPPGVEPGDDEGGWYSVPIFNSGPYRPLCQLRSCYRTECINTDNTAECGNNQTEGKVSDGTEGKVAGSHACGPSLTQPKNGPRASSEQPVSGQP